MSKEKIYYGCVEIAQRIGVSTATASRLVKLGRINHRRVGPANRLIIATESDLLAYLSQREQAAPAAA